MYRIPVAERGLTGIANIFRSRSSGLDDLLRAGTVPLKGPWTTGSICPSDQTTQITGTATGCGATVRSVPRFLRLWH